MVQEYQSPVRVYKHPFELIMAVSLSVCLCVCFRVRNGDLKYLAGSYITSVDPL